MSTFEELLELSEDIANGLSVDTSSIPDPKDIGYQKRDRRRKTDIDHMYRRNLMDKVIKINKQRKATKIEEAKNFKRDALPGNWYSKGTKKDYIYDIYTITGYGKGMRLIKLDSLNEDEFPDTINTDPRFSVNKISKLIVNRNDGKTIVYDAVGTVWEIKRKIDHWSKPEGLGPLV